MPSSRLRPLAAALALAAAGGTLALAVPAAPGADGGAGPGGTTGPTTGATTTTPTAPAKRTTAVGISDESPLLFASPAFTSLATAAVRVTVPVDYRSTAYARSRVEAWLTAARDGRYDVLVTFQRPAKGRRPPNAAGFARFARDFMARHPWVRSYAAYNEPNLCSSLLCRTPKLAAAYWQALVSLCRRCTVLGADLVAAPPLSGRLVAAEAYGRSMRAAGARPRVWGLHNYTDANRFQTTWTRAAMRLPGDFWFDETGGMVSRGSGYKPPAYRYPASVAHQAKAVRYLFAKLARISSRVKRVYVYQWFAGPPRAWDSGLLNHDLTPRPALATVQAEIARRTR